MVHLLTAVTQLAALAAFGGGVAWLNTQAPRKVSQRVFKISWLLPTVAAGWVIFWLLSTGFINAPTRLQTTHSGLIVAHDAIRAECNAHLKVLRMDDAYTVISRRTKTAELVGEHAAALRDAKEHKSSLARALQPLLNSFLFHTGVAVAFVPALLRLLLLLFKIKRNQGRTMDAATKARFDERVRREWGVLLPVMNTVTLLSLCVSPTFYFYIEPGRASRCVYTSGHWYTFTCTLLTFAIVISHLYRNKEYCRSCMRLLTLYFAWLVLYVAMALMVLKTTQTFFHDSTEARDGMRQALPAFGVFMLVLVAFQFLTANKRDITDDLRAAKKAVATQQEEDGQQEEGEEEQPQEEEEVEKPKAKAKAIKKSAAAAVASPASPPVESPRASRSSSRKKAAAEAAPADVPDAPAAPSSSGSAPPPPPPPPISETLSSSDKPKIVIPPKSAASKPKAKASEGPDPDALFADIKNRAGKLRKVDRSSTGGGNNAGVSSLVPNPPGGLMDVLKAQMEVIRVSMDGEKEEEDEDEWKP